MASKQKKGIIGKICGLMGLLIIVGGVVLFLNMDNLAKTAVENVGTKTLGVSVNLEDLDINVQEKSITVNGITIANPAGYKSSKAVLIDQVKITADRISEDMLIFKEIAVTGTDINMEVLADRMNLSDIRNGMDTQASARDSVPASEKVKVIIRDLKINGATLNPSSALLDKELGAVALPDIRMRGIGEKSNGILASEAIAQILEQVAKISTQTAATSGFLNGMDAENLIEIRDSLGLKPGLLEQIQTDTEGLGATVKGLFSR